MTRHAVFVLGPAGSGKSTLCHALVQHCETIGRPVHVVNLDPAADDFKYQPTLDIRDLVTLADVMDELGYGPNGGLVYCMEYLLDNLDWLYEELGDYNDDFLIFDCPGQVELFTHLNVMRELGRQMCEWNFHVASVYLIDSQFIADPSKFMSGTLTALSCMMQVELPHINVISKMDLLGKRGKADDMETYFDPDMRALLSGLDQATDARFANLNRALGALIEDYSMVNFVPVDLDDEDSLSGLMAHLDGALQFGEDQEVNVPRDAPDDDDDIGADDGNDGGVPLGQYQAMLRGDL